MKRVLTIALPVAVVALVAAYALVLHKPAKQHARVAGEVYVLPKDFVVNLAADRFAKVSVALVLAPGHAAPSGAEGTTPPDGYGTLPQEALVRAIVTDELTGEPSDALIAAHGRSAVEQRIKRRILKTTDVDVDRVMLTDIAVQ
ncbi:MAG TPA: flagellar basal body-associated FliL family protein [Solirubrobacteraceae bacterium]|nr:flagellar basal body-associated FliL family protein [Solirubrobacteraceae bacterium]